MSFTDREIPTTLVNLILKESYQHMDIYAIKETLLQANPLSEHFLERYVKLIAHAIENPTKNSYKERHHILPSSMFPDYKKEKWNIISLSARQHFIAHWMLWKAFRNKEMTCAFWFMYRSSSKTEHRYNNASIYEKIKESISKNQSVMMKERWKNENFRESSIKKRSEVQKKNWNDHEYREKLSKSQKIKWDDEERKKTQSLNTKELWKNENFREKQKWTDERRLKDSINRSKNMYVITKASGEMIETHSLKKYAKENGYNDSALYRLLGNLLKGYRDIINITKTSK